MKLRKFEVIYTEDENGVTRPNRIAHVTLLREMSDPPGKVFDKVGVPLAKAHRVDIDLLNPRPEDDPNAQISAANIAIIKAAAVEHTKDGIYIDWDKQRTESAEEVTAATAALAKATTQKQTAEGELRLDEANEWMSVADRGDRDEWLTWTNARIEGGR